jgi:hypothetical protein
MTRSPICYTAGCMAQRCLCLEGMMRLARLLPRWTLTITGYKRRCSVAAGITIKVQILPPLKLMGEPQNPPRATIKQPLATR